MSNITWIFPRTDFFEPLNETTAVEDFYDYDEGRHPGAFRIVSLFMAIAMTICVLVFYISYQQEQRNRKRVENIREKRNAYARLANMDLEQPEDDNGEPIPQEISHHHRRTAAEPEKDISEMEISQASSKETEGTIVISESELMISPQSLKTYVQSSNSSEGNKEVNNSELDMDVPLPRVFEYHSPQQKEEVPVNKKPLDADLTLLDDFHSKETSDELADRLASKLEGFVYNPDEVTPAKTTTYLPPTTTDSMLPLLEIPAVTKPEVQTEVIHQRQIEPQSPKTQEQPRIILPKASNQRKASRDPDGHFATMSEVPSDDDLSHLQHFNDVFQQDNQGDEKSQESSALFDTGAVMENFTEQPPMINTEPTLETSVFEDSVVAESKERVELSEPETASTPESDSDEHAKTTVEEVNEMQLADKEVKSFATANDLETDEQHTQEVDRNMTFVSVASVEEIPQQEPPSATSTTETTSLTTMTPVETPSKSTRPTDSKSEDASTNPSPAVGGVTATFTTETTSPTTRTPVETPSKSTHPTDSKSEDASTNPSPAVSGVKGIISALENSAKKSATPSPPVSGDKPWLRDFKNRPSLKDSTKLLVSKLPALEDTPDKKSTNSPSNEQEKASKTCTPPLQEDSMQESQLKDHEQKRDVTDTQTTTTITTSSVEESSSAPDSVNNSDPPGFRYLTDAEDYVGDGMV